MGFFKVQGTIITYAPWPFALLMPVVSILLIIFGLLGKGEIEDRVSNIWIPEGTQYYDDRHYKDDVVGKPAASVMSAVARPREEGSNILTADNLLEMRNRMEALEQATVEVDGMTFHFEDVCYNLDAYRYPCFRMTPLDCFAEGGYSWDTEARSKFFGAALESATRDLYKGFVDRLTAEVHCQQGGVLQNILGGFQYGTPIPLHLYGYPDFLYPQYVLVPPSSQFVDETMFDNSTSVCTHDIIEQGEHSLIFWEMKPKQFLEHVIPETTTTVGNTTTTTPSYKWGDTGTQASVQLPPDAGACKCCVDDNVAALDSDTRKKYYYAMAHLAVGTGPLAMISLIPEYAEFLAFDPSVGGVVTFALKHPARQYYDYSHEIWTQLDMYTFTVDSDGTKDYTDSGKKLSDVLVFGLNAEIPATCTGNKTDATGCPGVNEATGLYDDGVCSCGAYIPGVGFHPLSGVSALGVGTGADQCTDPGCTFTAAGPDPMTPPGWDVIREAMVNQSQWDGGPFFSPPRYKWQEIVIDGLVDQLLPNVLKMLMSSSEEEFDLDGAKPYEGFDVVNAPGFQNYDENNKDADINRPKLSKMVLTGENAAQCQTNEAFAAATASEMDYGFLKNCFQLVTGAQLLADADLCDPVTWLVQLCSAQTLEFNGTNTCENRALDDPIWASANPGLAQAGLAAMGLPALAAHPSYPGAGAMSYYSAASYQTSLFTAACPLMCKTDSDWKAMADLPSRRELRESATDRNQNDHGGIFSVGFDYPSATCSVDRLNVDGNWTEAELSQREDKMAEADVLEHSSKLCYMFDQGAALPPVQTAISYGGPSPKPFDYGSWSLNGIPKTGTDEFYEGDDLTKLEAIQNLFILIAPDEGSQNIVERLKNRDDAYGGSMPVTKAQAEEALSKMKSKLEDIWTDGWDGTEGSMQFNSFTDDNSVGGTFADAMDATTREMESLGMVSYGATIVVSVWFLYDSSSFVRSRVTLAWWGVVAAILALGGGLGIYCFFEKLNVAQMWTVPFLLLGIGIDDMYIMSLAAASLPKGKSANECFLEAYTDVAVPMTMTSLTLIAMFGIMNFIRVPAVYLTAFSACICVAILWLSNMLSFAAMVLLDLRRQEANRMDVIWCAKSSKEPKERTTCLGFMYKNIYHPIQCTLVGKVVVGLLSLGLLGISAYGITDIVTGLTIGDFAKSGTQMGAWVDTSQKLFGTWTFSMNWIGEETDYTSGAAHMKMTKSWEMVAEQDHVLANSSQALLFPTMALWGMPADMSPLYNHGNKNGRFSSDYCNKSFTSTTANCSDMLARAPFDPAQEKVPSASTCKSTFVENTENLKLYAEPGDLLYAEQGSFSGVCLKGSNIKAFIANLPSCDSLDPLTTMTYDDDKEYCPIMEFTDEAHFQTCYELMAAFTNLDSIVGAFTYDQLETESAALHAAYDKHDSKAHVRPKLPIKVISSGSGTNVHLKDSAAYIDLIKATRPHCDDKRGSGEPRCFIDGIAYTYWEQYLEIESWLWKAVASALVAGWLVSSLFILSDLIASPEVQGSFVAKFFSSCSSGFLIAFVCAYCTFVTLGVSMLAGVQLSGFSAMSCILSVGFAVEYAVHIVHRFIKSPEEAPSARAEYAMDVLYKPTFMAFVSTAIGVVCIGFSGIHFVTMTFFTPLLITCVSTYFGGILLLPLLLNVLGPCMTAGLNTSDVSRRMSVTVSQMEDDGL